MDMERIVLELLFNILGALYKHMDGTMRLGSGGMVRRLSGWPVVCRSVVWFGLVCLVWSIWMIFKAL